MIDRRSLLGFLSTLPFVGWCLPSLASELNESSLVSGEINIKEYAVAGETVTCTNGHPICDFIQSVYPGQIQDLPRQLGNWRQTEPTAGQLPLPVCEKCGEKFYLFGGYFHIGDSWRDTHGPLRIVSVRNYGLNGYDNGTDGVSVVIKEHPHGHH